MRSYAEVGARLSDKGILVVVVSMEPFRLAYHHLGADSVSMKRIMKKVQQHLPPNVEWTIMGHSMGCFSAMRLFLDFSSNKQKQEQQDIVKMNNKLVLWGVAAFLPFVVDLSDHPDAHVLLVQGSDDQLVESLKVGQDALEACFPSQTTQKVVIMGGTHDGFASYIVPNSSTMTTSDDGGGLRPREDQHDQACSATARFLLGSDATTS